MAKSPKVGHVTPSSGNVFADLKMPNADLQHQAAEMSVRLVSGKGKGKVRLRVPLRLIVRLARILQFEDLRGEQALSIASIKDADAEIMRWAEKKYGATE